MLWEKTGLLYIASKVVVIVLVSILKRQKRKNKNDSKQKKNPFCVFIHSTKTNQNKADNGQKTKPKSGKNS